MSYSDIKITQADINENNVRSASDILIGNADDNKAVFDKLPEFIASKHNELVDALAELEQGDTEALEKLFKEKLNSPMNGFEPNPGNNGDVLTAEGDGRTKWTDRNELVSPWLDVHGEELINSWLDEHPEATTTVQDGSLTESKFSNALKLKAIKDYVTPEMFGAVGDGVADDTDAFAQCMLNNKVALLPDKSYKVSSKVDILADTIIEGNYASVVCGGASPFHIIGDNVSIEHIKLYSITGQTRYGVEIATGVKNARINDIYGESLKYSLIMNDGENSIISGCYAVECGWDCVSNYSSAKNSSIQDCYSIRTGRHGFSTDEGADGISFINCYAEDIGSIVGEGHSCFHLEGAKNCKIINCKAVYTANHPKLNNFGSDMYIGLRVDTASTALLNNIIDGLEIIYKNGFSADNTPNIKPFYFNAPSTLFRASLDINNLKIINDTSQIYESYLGLSLVALSNFYIKGRLPIKQYSDYGLITQLTNGEIDLIDSASDFYFAQYIANGLYCSNVHAKNCNRVVRGRLVNCIIENCFVENCVSSFMLTQQAGDSTKKSSGNIIRNNIFSDLTNGITLGWWDGTQNNIIAENTFKGTIDTILLGNYAGCYFYDNIQIGLTYTTAKTNVTLTTTPPSLNI